MVQGVCVCSYVSNDTIGIFNSNFPWDFQGLEDIFEHTELLGDTRTALNPVPDPESELS